MDVNGGHIENPSSQNIGDRSLHRDVAINGALCPRDTVALPALIVTEEASVNNTTHHRLSSSLGSLPSLWSTASSAVAAFGERTPQASAALLRPGPTTPHGHKHQRAKSASSSTTISSQPVIVRTYQGSRASSRTRSPHTNVLPTIMSRTTRLPPAEDFSFSAILRAVEPEIHGAIDAIAEICARSRMSLADEHGAHIPPTGEIREGDASFRGRSGPRYGYRAIERTLTAVPEASSSSERLAGGSKASSDSGKGKASAYGSLKSIITGRKGSHSSKPAAETSFNASESTFVTETENFCSHKANQLDQNLALCSLPSAALITSPITSNGVSMDTSVAAPATLSVNSTESGPHIIRNTQGHGRSRSSSSITSWLAWPRSMPSSNPQSTWMPSPRAETRLRDILQSSFTNNRRLSENYG